jgi:hypothetical protein
LRNNALEIFITNGKTYLLAFEHSQGDRDAAYAKLLSQELVNRVDMESEDSVTKKWKNGRMSNFEYLMHLNTLAGRSFNDLTQYPVFPFVLADYGSEELDLENAATFRQLQLPMGAQDAKRLQKFEEKYEQLVEMNQQPHYYGSHYSNVGTVLHFLVRIEPFTHYFIEFQGGRFDVPDRSFHSVLQTWQLSAQLSTSDVKELTPEFFYLPEFLQNISRFDMGVKQNGQRVDDVVLPPWAHGSARTFIERHRAALECRFVSEQLNHWIDLMFGYQQQGEEARRSKNVFHHLTYEGAVDIDSIADPVIKAATIAQISNYGQAPKQLFTKRHPKKNVQAQLALLQDTIYTTPDRLVSDPMWSTSAAVGCIMFVEHKPIALRTNKLLLLPRVDQYLSWNNWDRTLRVCSLDTGKLLSTSETDGDEVICARAADSGKFVVTGGTSCVLKVWRVRRTADSVEQLRLDCSLYGHTDSVLSVRVSENWSVILSGSRDRSCIIWDSNRLSYVRSLSAHEGTVNALCISQNNGDIVTCCDDERSTGTGTGVGSVIRLWSINGTPITRNLSSERILCAEFTNGPEGLARNVIATGLQNGTIAIWNCELQLLVHLDGAHSSPVTALAFNIDYTQLISGDEAGFVVSWSCKKPRELYGTANF